MRKNIQDKKALRKIYRNRVASIDPQLKRDADKKICKLVFSLQEYQDAEIIMPYLSLPDEVDTMFFVQESLKRGKRIVVPRILPQKGKMEAREIFNIGKGLHKNKYGIPEPDRNSSLAVSVSDINMCVIPGLSFDNKGCRLGQGGGYYDRFLVSLPSSAFTVGICYSCQVAQALPEDPWDKKVNCLVTESGIYRF